MKKTKRSNANPDFRTFLHPFSGAFHLNYWMRILAGPLVLLLLISAAALASAGKEPPSQQEKNRPPDFLIFGTVFTEKGFALPGTEIQVHAAGEKKVRGKATSDRRGEFAIRVPRSGEYEVTVKAKGYESQTQKVNAASGTSREDLVFRMKPETGGKEP